MKPDVDVVRRRDYRVGTVDMAAARELVELHHYTHACANTATFRHGLWREGEGVVGAALWMPPTARAAKGLAERHLGARRRHREVLVLSRLVVVPGEPKNAAGMLLAQSTRLAWRDPRWSLFVTFADTAEGHDGTIYRATGWEADGQTVPTTRWLLDGRVVSAKATRTRTIAEMRALGAVPTKSVKLRFVMLRPRPPERRRRKQLVLW